MLPESTVAEKLKENKLDKDMKEKMVNLLEKVDSLTWEYHTYRTSGKGEDKKFFSYQIELQGIKEIVKRSLRYTLYMEMYDREIVPFDYTRTTSEIDYVNLNSEMGVDFSNITEKVTSEINTIRYPHADEDWKALHGYVLFSKEDGKINNMLIVKSNPISFAKNKKGVKELDDDSKNKDMKFEKNGDRWEITNLRDYDTAHIHYLIHAIVMDKDLLIVTESGKELFEVNTRATILYEKNVKRFKNFSWLDYDELYGHTSKNKGIRAMLTSPREEILKILEKHGVTVFENYKKLNKHIKDGKLDLSQAVAKKLFTFVSGKGGLNILNEDFYATSTVKED